MADISDVTAALKAAIVALAYPNGTSAPSAFGVPVQIAEGWPLPATLDMIAGKPGVAPPSDVTLVSIYPVPGSTGDAGTVMNFQASVISRVTPGITATIDDTETVVTFAGTAVGGETATLIINGGQAFAYVCQAGDTAEAAATALAPKVAAAFPQAEADGTTLTITGTHSLVARIGATGVLGRKTHRQKTQIRIVAWSSNWADRNRVAAPIDAAIKAQVSFIMPDTSNALITYQGTNFDDGQERAGLFRRDLIYSALYDTIEQLPGVEIVGVGFTATLPGGASISASS